MYKRNSRLAGGRVLVLAAAMLPGPAVAAGFASARFGGELGHPTASNPTALYYNPAGIARASGSVLYLDGIVAVRSGTFNHAASPHERADPPGGEGANAGPASFRNVFGGPMLGATTRLGDFALGAAFFVPFGGRLRWDANPRFVGDGNFPLAADGVQRWHSITGAVTVAYTSAGVAYRLGRLALGLSANLIHASIVQTQGKNILGTGEVDSTREGRIELDVGGWFGSFGLGLLFEAVTDRLFLGASYQAQPGLGEMALTGDLTTNYDGASTPFAVTFRQALPDVTRLGAELRVLPRLSLRLHGDLTRWSVLGTQCISVRDRPCAVDPSGADVTPEASTVQNLRRRWRDTWAVRAGASFWPRADLELFVGGGAEKGAPPASTLEPSLMDADNVQGALGLRVALGDSWLITASHTRVHYFPRDNTGRSELAVAAIPTRRADAGGRYELGLSLFHVSLEKRFR